MNVQKSTFSTDDLSAKIAKTLLPTHQARGLPNECYVNEEYYQQEMQVIFHQGWFAVGFTADVRNAGDVCPKNIAGASYLLTRDAQNDIHVFHNVCRHRGHVLVTQAQNMPLIRCPYHSWCYSHKGALKKAPHVGGVGRDSHPDFDASQASLFPVRHAEWMGIIFINPSNDAVDFADYIAEPAKAWHEFADVPLYAHASDSNFGFQLNCNWKFPIENYCESYHLPWVHPALNSYSRLEDHYNIEGENCSGQGTVVYQPTLDEQGRRLTEYPLKDKKWQTGGEYLSIFPNLLYGVHKDHTFGLIVTPDGAGQTQEHGLLYYFDEDAIGEKYEILRRRMNENWYQVFKEDVTVVQGMHQGRKGSAYDGGVFSPVMDGPTHCFHKWVANKLTNKITQ